MLSTFLKVLLLTFSLTIPSQASELSYSDIERSKTLLRLMPLVSDFIYLDNNQKLFRFSILDVSHKERKFGNRGIVLAQLAELGHKLNNRATLLSIETQKSIKSVTPVPTVIFIQTPLSDTELDDLMDWARSNSILVFSPFEGDVERGVHAGLKIKQQTRLYLNIIELERSQIQIQADIYRISDVYRGGAE